MHNATDQRYAVDVRALARAGYLVPGRRFFIAFGATRPIGTVNVGRVSFKGAVNGNARLERTACHFVASGSGGCASAGAG